MARVGAGSTALLLLADPLSAKILRAHVDGPLRPAALHREIGWSARTTVRTSVARLQGAGALHRQEIDDSPYAVENELTPAGEDLLSVAAAVEAWLALAPGGPIAPDSNAAKAAIKGLVGGWDSTIVQRLARGPQTLAQLDSAIPALGYPSLKRHLSGMRLSHLVEPAAAGNGATANAVAPTEWLRRAVAPLAVAARFERLHMASTTTAMTAAELEATRMLTAPRLDLLR